MKYTFYFKDEKSESYKIATQKQTLQRMHQNTALVGNEMINTIDGCGEGAILANGNA